MKYQTFKKIVNDFFLENGFSKKGSYYYYYVSGMVIVAGLQKSGFSNGYYINVGYVITELNASINKPRDVDGDVRTRFTFIKDKKEIDFFDLDELLENDTDKLISIIYNNYNKYISHINSLEKLKILLQETPIMLYQTRLAARQLFGL